ncbi:hypothetical protein P8452_04278 [Trifolium repens]|nr:hypothetical protein P8452_04278 [Trifolium repens]
MVLDWLLKDRCRISLLFATAQLLMIVHHKNLVSRIGYCDEDKIKALVYKYMTNGNLQQQLSVKNTNILKWSERLNIAVDATHGGCKRIR